MSHPFSWCMAGPFGSKVDHTGCPGVIGGMDGIACSCSCGCFERGIALLVRDNGSGTDEPRPRSGRSATGVLRPLPTKDK